MTDRKRRINLVDTSDDNNNDDYDQDNSSINNKQKLNPWTGKKYSTKYYNILEKRQLLPVYQFKDKLIETIKNNQFVVVEGETGSGKTTQIPQFLVDDPNGTFVQSGINCIACTQPRRVAATSIARRVAEEMDVTLGIEVGYTIRFEDVSDKNRTVLKFVTDGMLLREAMSDPLLSRYSVIVLDEAHERTLSTDVLMGLLQEIYPKRTKKSKYGELKVIIMSATLDATKFQEYFHNAPLLKVPGRTYPVEVFYTAEPERNYVEAAVRTIIHIHQCEGPGDILVFLTGEQEIEQACEEIRQQASSLINSSSSNDSSNSTTIGQLVVYPLYSSLPPAQQQKIFDPAPGPTYVGGPNGRKVVVSTNIAETSLTIDGIVYVVDPGFSKQKVYNPRIRVESLLVSPISRASARQRAGRAGRTQPGKCFRLYTEKSFYDDLQETTYPEILRSKMSNVVLTLKKLGIHDLVNFDYFDSPAPETLMRALELLNYLGAIDDNGDLTNIGYQMSELPLDPQLAKLILVSPEYNCSDEVISIVACLSVPQLFLRPLDNVKAADTAKAQFNNNDSDHITMLNAYSTYQKIPIQQQSKWCWDNYINDRAMKSITNVRQQLVSICTKLNIPIISSDNKGDGSYSYTDIRKALTSSMYMQVAYRQRSGDYITIKDNQIVSLHPSTVISGSRPTWVLYEEFVLTTKNYIRTNTITSVDWLIDVASHYFDMSNFPECETKNELELAYRRLAQSQHHQQSNNNNNNSSRNSRSEYS